MYLLSTIERTGDAAWRYSARNVKKADLLRMRVVEGMNRPGRRLQQDCAAFSRKIRLGFRR